MKYKANVADLHALSTDQLRTRRARLAKELPGVEKTLRGALQTQKRRCSKKGCHCGEGELHGPYVYLSVRGGEGSRMVYIPAELAEEVKQHVEITGRIEATLGEISAINLELLARGELS